MLGNILKNIRKLKKLTQDDVAKYLSIKRQTYSAYERNISVPDANTLCLLADFFNVTTDYLLNRSNTSLADISDEEKQIIELYRKLPHDMKIEIKGQIKGILLSFDEQTASSDVLRPKRKAI